MVRLAPASWADLDLDVLAAQTIEEAERRLVTDFDRGLTAHEAAARLLVAGPNDPAPVTQPSWPRVLVRQFLNKLIVLLIVATMVTLALGELLNAVAIAVTVVVSGVFGFVNEYRSERAIAALRRLTARQAEVLRDGLHEDIPASVLVPGDLLVLSEGDVVAADARVVDARGLRVNESILTGEPEAVAKSVEAAQEPGAVVEATAVYAGTTVAAGSGRAVVVATGKRTILGSIAATVQRPGRRATPLEARLDQLGNRLVLLFLALCVLLVGLGLVQGFDTRLVITMAVSLAIGAVPEGLPAVATTTLALAVRRLAGRNVLVRRLDAVETLGSTAVIVTDKTGTLTENRMVVRWLLLPDGRRLRLDVDTESGPTIQTSIRRADGSEPAPGDREAGMRLLLTAALCNDAVAEYDEEHGWHIHGDPSEGAIVLAATGLGLDGATLHERYPRRTTEPFSAATRLMATTHGTPEGGVLFAVKGAFEPVAARACDARPVLADAVHQLGDAGFRVFTVAAGDDAQTPRLLGAVVLEDPVRGDAAEAVAACRAAGIRLLLVTGDQLSTATTVARGIGLLNDHATALRADELDPTHLGNVAVVARATHQQKEQIVGALQAAGGVVAMTGDGVNDAAAMHAADVGVAVGPGATDVAVEAAHIVLTDGRLRSLASGIGEGRAIIRSLRQAIVYLLTASFGTILLMTLSIAVGRPLVLAPLQILWLNLVVHVFPALALATGAEPAGTLTRPTRTLLPNASWLEIAWRSLAVAAAGMAALFLSEGRGESVSSVQTMVFLTLALSLVGQAFLVGVESAREQWARVGRRAVWGGVGISLVLLLLAIYLPGLNTALGLEPVQSSNGVAAFVLAGVACATAQCGAVILRRRFGAM